MSETPDQGQPGATPNPFQGQNNPGGYGADASGTGQYGAGQYGDAGQYGAGQPGYQQGGYPQGGYQQPGYGHPQPGYQQPGYGYPQPGYQQPYGYAPMQPVGASSPDDLTLPLYGASFAQAIRRYFKSYARFTGRASRSEYWFSALGLFLIGLVPTVLFIVSMIVMTTSMEYEQRRVYRNGYSVTETVATTPPAPGSVVFVVICSILIFAVYLATLVPSLAITWRRLHDSNQPGPMYFLSLIPYAGGLILFILLCMPSKAEGARFDLPGAGQYAAGAVQPPK